MINLSEDDKNKRIKISAPKAHPNDDDEDIYDDEVALLFRKFKKLFYWKGKWGHQHSKEIEQTWQDQEEESFVCHFESTWCKWNRKPLDKD